MRYALADIEITDPRASLRIAEDESGAGILVRHKHCPIGFFMTPAKPGTIEGISLRELLIANVGTNLIAAQLDRELTPSPRAGGAPTVTVAVCTRNHPDYVARVIRSLLATSAHAAKELDILIVDNAPSDDQTQDVAASFPGVRYVREPRQGLDFARNRAIHKSSGDILAFVDDDAVVDQWWLSGLLKAVLENPEAGGFTGPILPLELATRAQILFELRGGFGRQFERRRYGPESVSLRNYPCNAGIFGSGCNMAFRRDALLEIGGFDEALDTGAPLPGGGDLDIFYRVIRADRPIAYEPQLVIFHQHRREYSELRRQMYTWGLGMMAYAVRNYRADRLHRVFFRCMILGWFRAIATLAVKSARKSHFWQPDLAIAELWGGCVGLFGGYDRSLRRTERIRKSVPV